MARVRGVALEPEPSGVPPNPYRRSLLKQERSRQTREKLIRAAVRLWRAQGFEDTTVEEVSDAAGVAVSTFYYHFPSKDDLILELSQLTAAITDHDVSDSTGSLAGDFERFIVAIAARISRSGREVVSPTVNRTISGLRFIDRSGPPLPASFSGTLLRILDLGVTNGELDADADTFELSAIATGMFMEGILRWSSETTPTEDLEMVLRLRAAVFLRGLGAEREAAAGRHAPEESA